MKVKVIIFDLDDTLYNEIDYVYSGFKAVSSYFSKYYELEVNTFYHHMLDLLQKNGRGNVFDDILSQYNIYSKKNVKKALSVYRTHKPEISLSKQTKELLRYYNSKNIPIYIITDGNKIVQSNKITSLNLDKFVKKSFITHRYGKIHSKPSTYCFEKIAKLEKVNFHDIIYIGDNINKDFVNIKKLGFRTIRIINGMFKDVIQPLQYHAEIDIENLTGIKSILSV